MREQSIDRLNGAIWRCVDEIVVEIRGGSGHVANVYALMHKHMVRTMVRFAFGTNCPIAILEDAASFDRSSLASWIGMFAPSVARRLYPARARLVEEARLSRLEVLKSIRRGEDTYSDSLLHAMVDANNEAEAPLSDDELISNAIGIGIGGNDSSASGCTSMLYELARDAALVRMLCEEHHAVAASHMLRDTRSFDHLLPAASAVVAESLRVHPPFGGLVCAHSICCCTVPGFVSLASPLAQVPRCAVADFELGSYKFFAGNWFLVDLRALHERAGLYSACFCLLLLSFSTQCMFAATTSLTEHHSSTALQRCSADNEVILIAKSPIIIVLFLHGKYRAHSDDATGPRLAMVIPFLIPTSFQPTHSLALAALWCGKPFVHRQTAR
jgi:cytochrome P450